MENIRDTRHGAATVVQGADIAFDEGELAAARRGCERRVQIVAVAGGEVVQPHYRLPQPQQPLHQVGTDKAGGAGDQPAGRGIAQLARRCFHCIHDQPFLSVPPKPGCQRPVMCARSRLRTTAVYSSRR